MSREPERVPEFVGMSASSEDWGDMLTDSPSTLNPDDLHEVVPGPDQDLGDDVAVALYAAKLAPPRDAPKPAQGGEILEVGESDILTATGVDTGQSRFDLSRKNRPVPERLACPGCVKKVVLNDLCDQCGQLCTKERQLHHQMLMKVALGAFHFNNPTARASAEERRTEIERAVQDELERIRQESEHKDEELKVAQAEIEARAAEEQLMKQQREELEVERRLAEQRAEQAEKEVRAAVMVSELALKAASLAKRPAPAVIAFPVPAPKSKSNSGRSVQFNQKVQSALSMFSKYAQHAAFAVTMCVCLLGCAVFAYADDDDKNTSTQKAQVQPLQLENPDQAHGKPEPQKSERSKKAPQPRRNTEVSPAERWKQFAAKYRGEIANVESSLGYTLSEIPAENTVKDPVAIQCSSKARDAVGALLKALGSSGFNTGTGKFSTVLEDLKRYESWQNNACSGRKR